jgi:pyruvate/2-oxoacid:ferredoxin oxidoreductase alpha subunit/pyruvate/2-oxoacid:ferredoxin oxidoreductase beta subunit/NAD-dependent dihydropyrimidine dehydrogenase PreA subunit
MAFFKKSTSIQSIKYSGLAMTMDGTTVISQCEGEFSDKPRLCSDASIVAGLAMSGLRASYASAFNVGLFQESLAAAVNKHLPYVIHINCDDRQSGHKDYHAIDKTGCIQLFAKNRQASADLTLIARKIAELCLNPVALAQEGKTAEALQFPESALIHDFLGNAEDQIPSPTESQRILYGETRRRIPESWSVDQPMNLGNHYSPALYRASVAAQRPYFFNHLQNLIDACMSEWFELTGRDYQRLGKYQCQDADYLIIAQGKMVQIAEAVADYAREHEKIKCGVVDITVFRPFPSDLISMVCQRRKGVTVMEQCDYPLTDDLPIIADIRRAMSKSIENGVSNKTPYPNHATYSKITDSSPLYSACFGFNDRELAAKEVMTVIDNMLPTGNGKRFFYLGVEFMRTVTENPKHQIQREAIMDAYPQIQALSLKTTDNEMNSKALNPLVNAQQAPEHKIPSSELSASFGLLQQPTAKEPTANIHRFFEQTGADAINGREYAFADPFLATGTMPAATGLFQDLTATRTEHPLWVAENCTACGNCYAMCPDSAIPGLINTVSEVFETTIKRLEKTGKTVKYLRRAIRLVEKQYHALTTDKTEGTNLQPIFARAIGETIKGYPEADREAVGQEFEAFKKAMGDFKFALTKPYHNAINKRTPNQGGLYSITINPLACKGCMECVEVCDDEALKPVPQTAESIEVLRRDWDFWNELPTSNPKYKRIDDLDEKIGALDTLLLDKKNYFSMTGGDNAESGSGEKTAVHLLTSTVVALMQPRVKKHLLKIEQLIVDMEKHIRLILAENLDIIDIETVEAAIETNKAVDLTLSKFSATLDENKASQPIDRNWLKRVAHIVTQLKQLKAHYLPSQTHNMRAEMGGINSKDETSEWGAGYPFNPYPFPWANHLFADAPSLAMGIFEGHMHKMAKGFKVIRQAELELSGKYDLETAETFFNTFNWPQFSEEEYRLCPPIIMLGGEKALAETGLQALSNSLLSGMPLKVLVLESQSTETHTDFIQQLCTQSPYSEEWHTQVGRRKELSLLAMGHQTTYVLQSSIAHTNHLLEGYIDGLNYRGAAVFNVYAVNQTKHQVPADAATKQSKLAVASRAYPLISFDPRISDDWETNLSLQGNPERHQDWSNYTLEYKDEYGLEEKMTLPLTFADWAFTEGRFQAYFKPIPPSKWHDDMVALVDFIDLSAEDKVDSVAFIYSIHSENKTLVRVVVAAEMVQATIERRHFWRTLKGLAGLNREIIDPIAIATQAKAEVAQSLAARLMKLAGGDGQALTDFITTPSVTVTAPIQATTPSTELSTEPSQAVSGNDSVWIETPDCTTCDECIDIAPAIFQYNDDKKAVVINPTAGTYEQIVKAAEKCTAVIIHPGTPWNLNEKNLEKLIKRAEKFQ